ncbi:hypothetical protein M426DRAFT_41516, partial [Hypoxylon sp. CI-4A]
HLDGPPASGTTVKNNGVEPLIERQLDTSSFDLVTPQESSSRRYSLETRSDLLLSAAHLKVIFDDPRLFKSFKDFLLAVRPKSVPVLVSYLNACMALGATGSANSTTKSLAHLEGLEISQEPIPELAGGSVGEKAQSAFDILVQEDLPAYITHTWVRIVSKTIELQRTGGLPQHLTVLSEALAEGFYLTDPSKPDNPVILASQGESPPCPPYDTNYAIGQNCRFLQGVPRNSSSARRIREQLEAGVERSEIILNYRRDRTPFMNLLTIAPLFDSGGIIHYYLGVLVDVSDLVEHCAGLESFERLVSQNQDGSSSDSSKTIESEEFPKDGFRELIEIATSKEMETVRKLDSAMYYRERRKWATHKEAGPDKQIDAERHDLHMRRNTPSPPGLWPSSFYEYYLLVRPHPDLRVLFASPSLRIPRMLQSDFMSRVGGEQSTIDAVLQAFVDGTPITTKIRWLTRANRFGRRRWLHCTPLQGADGTVGIWLVVLFDDKEDD